MLGHALNPGYIPGEYWNCCDRCGFHFLRRNMKMTWDGLLVCHYCWEPRHPQDFVRGRKERIVPSCEHRPDCPGVELNTTEASIGGDGGPVDAGLEDPWVTDITDTGADPDYLVPEGTFNDGTGLNLLPEGENFLQDGCFFSSARGTWTKFGGGNDGTINSSIQGPDLTTGECVWDMQDSSTGNFHGLRSVAGSGSTSRPAEEDWVASLYIYNDGVLRATRYAGLRLEFGFGGTEIHNIHIETGTGQYELTNSGGNTTTGGVQDSGLNWWRIWVSSSATVPATVRVIFFPAIGLGTDLSVQDANGLAQIGSSTQAIISYGRLEKGTLPTGGFDNT